MRQWIRDLDLILRGQATTPAALAGGELRVPVFGLLVLVDAMGLLYGLCMSVFTLSTGGRGSVLQTLSCMFKTPALFLLTLGVTLPSLYVFNAMVGSRLTLRAMFRLLVATLGVILAVMASVGPIVAFFSLTTTSYPFMILLNVAVGGLAGCLGLRFLLQTLHRTAVATFAADVAAEAEAAEARPLELADPLAVEPSAVRPGPLSRSADHPMGRHVRLVFHIWLVVFALVGTQMAWVLSPFLGHPGGHFVLFRPTGSNFFQGVLDNVHRLMQ